MYLQLLVKSLIVKNFVRVKLELLQIPLPASWFVRGKTTLKIKKYLYLLIETKVTHF